MHSLDDYLPRPGLSVPVVTILDDRGRLLEDDQRAVVRLRCRTATAPTSSSPPAPPASGTASTTTAPPVQVARIAIGECRRALASAAGVEAWAGITAPTRARRSRTSTSRSAGADAACGAALDRRRRATRCASSRATSAPARSRTRRLRCTSTTTRTSRARKSPHIRTRQVKAMSRLDFVRGIKAPRKVLGNYTKAARTSRRGEFGIYVGDAMLIFELFRRPTGSSIADHWNRWRLRAGGRRRRRGAGQRAAARVGARVAGVPRRRRRADGQVRDVLETFAPRRTFARRGGRTIACLKRALPHRRDPERRRRAGHAAARAPTPSASTGVRRGARGTRMLERVRQRIDAPRPCAGATRDGGARAATTRPGRIGSMVVDRLHRAPRILGADEKILLRSQGGGARRAQPGRRRGAEPSRLGPRPRPAHRHLRQAGRRRAPARSCARDGPPRHPPSPDARRQRELVREDLRRRAARAPSTWRPARPGRARLRPRCATVTARSSAARRSSRPRSRSCRCAPCSRCCASRATRPPDGRRPRRAALRRGRLPRRRAPSSARLDSRPAEAVESAARELAAGDGRDPASSPRHCAKYGSRRRRHRRRRRLRDRGGDVVVARPPCKVVDTTGAGDAFLGGLLAGLRRGPRLGGRRAARPTRAAPPASSARRVSPRLAAARARARALRRRRAPRCRRAASREPRTPRIRAREAVVARHRADRARRAARAHSTRALRRAVALIAQRAREGGRVHVTGVGKPEHVARYGAALLASTGTPATFLHAHRDGARERGPGRRAATSSSRSATAAAPTNYSRLRPLSASRARS